LKIESLILVNQQSTLVRRAPENGVTLNAQKSPINQ